MLGWEIFITQKDPQKASSSSKPFIAKWMTGLGGDRWIKDLVNKGLAEDIATNSGYPHTYSAKAKFIFPLITSGLPQYKGSTVIGDDYFLEGDANWNIEIDELEMSKCDPEDELLVEAWDQS